MQAAFGLALTQQDSLNKAVRNLCDLVNEHTVLLMALMKKFGTNPNELMELLSPADFVNPADTGIIEPPNASGN